MSDNENPLEELRRRKSEAYANPYKPAKRGYVDDVIEPTETRRRPIDDLELLARERADSPPKNHGNVPL